MKHYAICSSPNMQKYSAVVIATGTARPHEELDQVASDLRRCGARGRVIFDLLTANGTRTPRYFAIDFDGDEFPVISFQRIEPDDDLRQLSAQFFASHIEELDMTLLTPAMRFLVKRGVTL